MFPDKVLQLLPSTLPSSHQVCIRPPNKLSFKDCRVNFTTMSCSKFPPSLHAAALPSGLCEELKAAALVPMDALLLQLLPLRTFAEVVLQQDQRELNSGLLYLHQLCVCGRTSTLAHVSQFILNNVVIIMLYYYVCIYTHAYFLQVYVQSMSFPNVFCW